MQLINPIVIQARKTLCYFPVVVDITRFKFMDTTHIRRKANRGKKRRILATRRKKNKIMNRIELSKRTFLTGSKRCTLRQLRKKQSHWLLKTSRLRAGSRKKRTFCFQKIGRPEKMPATTSGPDRAIFQKVVKPVIGFWGS